MMSYRANSAKDEQLSVLIKMLIAEKINISFKSAVEAHILLDTRCGKKCKDIATFAFSPTERSPKIT